jgi:hypothetical protein
MDDKKRKRAVTRYIMPILVLVSVASLLPVFGCRGQESIPEKQAIEATYNCLINKAEQLQGSKAKLSKGQIDWGFHSAVLNAAREAIYSDDGLGKSVEIYLDRRDTEIEARNQSAGIPKDASYKIPTSSNALKTLAQDEGDGLWIVTINEWELEFNERTGEVRAKNNEAAKLLEEITLRTYHNTKYGYSINYPPEWNVLDVIKEGVNISYVSSDGTMEAAIFVNSLPKIQELGLNDYAEKRVNSFRHDSYQIHMAEGNPTIGGIVADIVGLKFDNFEKLGNYIGYEAKWYFIEKGEMVYEILTVARPMPFANMTILFDPYPSFRLQP